MSNLIVCLLIIVVLFFILLSQQSKREGFQDPILIKLRHDLRQLSPLVDKLQFYSSDKSFTEDKQRVYLCLRDPKSGVYYPYNTLIYVSIHELSHVMDKEIIEGDNHNKGNFSNIFSELLRKANDLGIYNPNESIVQNYCGING